MTQGLCPTALRWQGLACWRILDTRLDLARVLHIASSWLTDPQRCRVLHLVVFAATPPTPEAIEQAAQAHPEQRELARELAQAAWGLLPGMHRLNLCEGQLQLTLCIGEGLEWLRAQQFAADAVILDSTPTPTSTHAVLWNRFAGKALSRCCRRGTIVTVLGDAPVGETALLPNGFVPQNTDWVFNPSWDIKRSREHWPIHGSPISRCAVIGAGLAGAAVAEALSRRSWAVSVLDSAAEPAAGASGLPAGLLVAHVSADDSPRSRLSRAGVRLMLSQAERHLVRGRDWDDAGVLERRLDGRSGLPAHWPEAGHAWAQESPDIAAHTGAAERALFHRRAAWLRPAALIRAWLSLPGVTFMGNARVARLRWHEGLWSLQDAQGRTLAQAEHVVLANAEQALPLLLETASAQPELQLDSASLPALHGMRGCVSWGLHQAGEATALPPTPVNGQGSLIPSVTTAHGPAWYLGATYEASDVSPAPLAHHHEANWAKLQVLLPELASRLAPRFQAGDVAAWTGTRCVSQDRMPLVGPLQHGAHPSLWMSAAMGSRGLSFSALCAELLASHLGAEPLPVEASLAQFLRATRAGG